MTIKQLWRPWRRAASATTIVSFLIAVGGCVAKREDPAVARAAIEAANKQFADAFNRDDARGMAALYGETAQLLPPGSQPLEGRTAIETFWRGIAELPIADLQLQTVDVESHPDGACEVGRYKMIGSDGGEIDSGKYIVIWKRDATGWKIYRDIWNSSVPPATAASGAGTDSAR